jgi:hypothetical protein
MAKPALLKNVLDQSLHSLELDRHLKAYSLWGAWSEIVGEAVAANARPQVIRNHLLFVEVSHPAWMQELQFLKPTLLEKITAFLGEPLIRDIRFRLGKIEPPALPSEAGPDWKDERLDAETLKRIEATVETVSDPETRSVLRNVLTRGAQLEHHRSQSK